MTVPIVQKYFVDPIGGKLLEDPVMNHCGHTYSKTLLNQWKDLTKESACPLCKAPLQGLLTDALLQQATALASTPTHREYSRIDQFTDEDQEIIEAAIAQINQRRDLDIAEKIPSKLDPYFGSSVLDRASTCSKEVTTKICSC